MDRLDEIIDYFQFMSTNDELPTELKGWFATASQLLRAGAAMREYFHGIENEATRAWGAALGGKDV